MSLIFNEKLMTAISSKLRSDIVELVLFEVFKPSRYHEVLQ